MPHVPVGFGPSFLLLWEEVGRGSEGAVMHPYCLVVGMRMVTPQFLRVLACVLSAQNPKPGISICWPVALLAGTCFANRPDKARPAPKLNRPRFFPSPEGERVGPTEDSGGDSGGATPVPIPNTEVKSSSADGTARATGWESRSPPALTLQAR